MKLTKEEFLTGCKNPEAFKSLLVQGEKVLRTWQPIWSPFLPAPLVEDCLQRMNRFSELHWKAEGGYCGAERQRLLCIRAENEGIPILQEIPIMGIQVRGNFLFDSASPIEVRKTLRSMGAPTGGLGDIWMQGDRGAEVLCTPESALILNGQIGSIRTVEIQCSSLERSKLHFPTKRVPRKFFTVEASSRLDAIASAGFGVSRAKIVAHIKEGRLRVNWETIKQPSKLLGAGDRLHLEDRGSLEVISLEATKRQRWRVEMMRR